MLERRRTVSEPDTPDICTAVILMAYGSPERIEDIPAYLSDIRRGRPVSDRAVHELTERYRRIGGRSPLAEVTEAQRRALERETGLRVHTGMKHWTPRIDEAAERAVADGAATVVGLVLAPHYSRLSIGGYRERLEHALDGRAELRFVDSWHDHEPFIAVLADRVSATFRMRGWTPTDDEIGGAHVVFTAHSLPERILADGDPYRDELLATSRLVAERLGVGRWSFAFQSASPTGEPWLGPDVLDELTSLAHTGVERVVLDPVGFVSDHLEILWDLDVEARERAAELDLELERMLSLNDDPPFIRALASLVRGAAGYAQAGEHPRDQG